MLTSVGGRLLNKKQYVDHDKVKAMVEAIPLLTLIPNMSHILERLPICWGCEEFTFRRDFQDAG